MPCSIEVTNNAVVYWGLANAVTHDATTFETWNQAQVDALIAVLNSETANGFNPTGYFFDNPTADTDTYAWLVVPNDFADPLPELGIQYGPGVVVNPTEMVRANEYMGLNVTPFPVFLPIIPTAADALLWNASIGSQASNGWNYALATVNGISYRFYVLKQIKQTAADALSLFPFPFVDISRIDDFVYFVSSGPYLDSGPTQFVGTVDSPDFPAFNVTEHWIQFESDAGAATATLTVLKPGGNESHLGSFTLDVLTNCSCSDTTIDGDIGDLEFTLFVSTPAVPQTADTIYWGFAPAATYDPSDWDTWDATKQANFLTALGNSEDGPYRVTAYNYTAAAANSIAWFVVPNSYDRPVSDTGFLTNDLGSLEPGRMYFMTLAGIVQASVTQNGAVTDYGQAVNCYITGFQGQFIQSSYVFTDIPQNIPQDFTGWTYFVRTIGGVAYRFYPIVLLYATPFGFMFSHFWNDGTTPDAFDLTVTT